jgi:paraquat-inducible protein A
VVPAGVVKSFRSEDLRHLMECRDCGLFQRILTVREGDVAACRRCHATLRRSHSNFATLACVCAAAVLFVFALGFPLMTLHAAGRYSSGTVFSGPEVLDRFGLASVGWLVLFTLVVAPALKLSILLTALLGQYSEAPPRWLPWLYGWLERIGPWAMVEVFLLGVFVAYTRLRAIASVEIGPSLIALFGVMLTMVAADATVDRHGIWEALERTGAPWAPRFLAPEKRVAARMIGCHVCGRVSISADRQPCPRCGHPLHHRKPNSLTRAWALLLAAAVLYIPANAYSIMTVTRLGRGGSHTILSGVVELFEDHLWPLAIIVLLASIVVPIAKLGALAVMLVTTHRSSASHLVHRTRVFRVIAVIGRWSMIDIFALTLLVALVRMGFLATVFPGEGAMAFAGVVVLTMLATECFDPRLMWDAAHLHHSLRLPAAAHSSLRTA